MHKINIGDNCMIGAGSVVTRDIPPSSIAYETLAGSQTNENGRSKGGQSDILSFISC
jgi:serine acetyltransferase